MVAKILVYFLLTKSTICQCSIATAEFPRIPRYNVSFCTPSGPSKTVPPTYVPDTAVCLLLSQFVLFSGPKHGSQKSGVQSARCMDLRVQALNPKLFSSSLLCRIKIESCTQFHVHHFTDKLNHEHNFISQYSPPPKEQQISFL